MMNELLIASICAGMSGPADMCKKTTEAVSKQTGLYQNVEKAEKIGESAATKVTKETLGNTVYKALAYGVMAGKISTGGSASMKMNGGPLCDKITVTGSKKQGTVGLGWNF